MSLPLISVCIVTYNHQDYISDCLSSVLSQDGNFNIEILVGDDASKDDTAKIVKTIIAKHNKSIRFFSHEKNLGPSQNTHFLINHSYGEFIAHLDGDDFWLPGKLQAQLAYLQKHTDCPACYTNAVVIDNDRHPWGFFNTPQLSTVSLESLILSGNFLNNSSLLYRSRHKNLLLAIPEELLDFRVHLLFAQEENLGLLSQVLTSYRINSHTSIQSSQFENFLLLYLNSLLSIQGQVSEEIFHQGILQFCRNNAPKLILSRNWGLISKLLKRIRKHHKLTSIQLFINVVPCVIKMEFSNFIYKQTSGRHLKFIQRNGA